MKTHLDQDPTMKDRLLSLLKLLGLEKRPVTLASGLTSQIYIDCRQVYLRGEAQHLIGLLLWEAMSRLEKEASAFDACGGMAMGAIPLTCALSQAAWLKGRDLPGVVVRKEPKSHGLLSVIEGTKGLGPGARILVLEDVITTAGSSLLAIEKLRAMGFAVSHVLALIDREQGGRQNLREAHVELSSLYTLRNFED